MEGWLRAALDRSWVKKIPSSTSPSSLTSLVTWKEAPSGGHDPTAMDSLDGVVFDWSLLHRSTVKKGGAPAATAQEYCKKQSNKAMTTFHDFLRSLPSDALKSATITTISLDRPWTLIPLNEAASEMSKFVVVDVPKAKKSSGSHDEASTTLAAAPEGEEDEQQQKELYAFIKGPPAQQPARDNITNVLQSVVAQLKQQGLIVFLYLSEVIIIGKSFEESLHRTAAVHKALKGTGLVIDGPRSCMVPRAVVELKKKETTTTTSGSGSGGTSSTGSSSNKFSCLDTKSLPRDQAIEFLRDAFVQWACDCYHWGCNTTEILSDPKALQAFVGDCVDCITADVFPSSLAIRPPPREEGEDNEEGAEKQGAEGDDEEGSKHPSAAPPGAALSRNQIVASVAGGISAALSSSSSSSENKKSRTSIGLSSVPPSLEVGAAGGTIPGTELTPTSGGGAQALRNWSRFEVRLFIHLVYGEGTLGFSQW